MWDDRGKLSLRTQRRWLERSAALLGLVQPSELSEPIRDRLRLPGLDHRQARIDFSAGRSLRERAGAVTSLLAEFAMDAELWRRLLAAGHLAGLWGPPALWRAGRVERLFPAGTERGRGAGRAPPEQSTKSLQ